jgi:hypothetical protein
MAPPHASLTIFAAAHRQHGLVSSRQLADSGHTTSDVRRLVRAGSLVPVRRGVYADGEVWQAADPWRARPLLRVRAAGLVLRCDDFVYSHDSAALVLDMGVPRASDCLVHVTRHKVHGDAERAGIKHHRAPYRPQDVVDVDGLRVLEPARTGLDMTREHGRAAGLAACDAALRRGASRADLEHVLERMRCWPRSRTMRWCVEWADRGAETYLESLVRDLVIELGIGVPQTQFGLSDGRRTVWCDIRVGRHFFEGDGWLKYDDDNPSGLSGREVLAAEKARQDFVTGFKTGISRVTDADCGPGRAAARIRLMREFTDTCRRFGTSIADLTPYVVSGRA